MRRVVAPQNLRPVVDVVGQDDVDDGHPRAIDRRRGVVWREGRVQPRLGQGIQRDLFLVRLLVGEKPLGYGRLGAPIGQNLVHLVSVSVDKQSAIRAVPVERNDVVTRFALHGTFAQGYGKLVGHHERREAHFRIDGQRCVVSGHGNRHGDAE